LGMTGKTTSDRDRGKISLGTVSCRRRRSHIGSDLRSDSDSCIVSTSSNRLTTRINRVKKYAGNTAPSIRPIGGKQGNIDPRLCLIRSI
jgi:hypothetical protein